MIVNQEEVHDCPDCGGHGTVIEVEFSTGCAAPDGLPGILCQSCNYKLSIDEMEGYEDGI